MISLQHAIILRVGSGALVCDTSLNGTYINDRRVVRCILRPNDIIRFGKDRRSPNLKFVFSGKSKMNGPRGSPISARSSSQLLIESLLSYIRCPLCKDYMVFPSQITPCGDFFCIDCIQNHVASRKEDNIGCPHCATPISDFMIRVSFKMTRIIENILSIYLSRTNFETFNFRFAKCKAELIAQQKQLANLHAKYESIDKSDGDPFLAIFQSWSEFERKKFSCGIAKYPKGEPREYYCWIVRLARDWVVHHANHTDLSVALFNLGLQSPGPIDTQTMRNRLLRFIFIDSM